MMGCRRLAALPILPSSSQIRIPWRLPSNLSPISNSILFSTGGLTDGLGYPLLMQVRVLYLGMLKDLAGREREVVQLSDGARLSDLYAELQQRMPKLQEFRNAIALSINYEYSDGAAVLQDNDEVALIPPVSGGTVERRFDGRDPFAADFGAFQAGR